MEHADFGNMHLDFAPMPGSLPLLARALDSAGDAILIIDADDRVVWANRAFADLSGFAPAEIAGANSGALHSQNKGVDSYNSLREGELSRKGTWRRELISKRRDGTTYFIEEIVTPLLDPSGAITHFVSVLHDVTQGKEALQKERLLARQDLLTGVAGRAHIVALLNGAVVGAQQSEQILALLFIDLDGFKSINDSHGHNVGDAVLKAVAARLQSVVRCSDTVGRFGGDEFVILLPTVARRSVAKRIAMHIVDQLSQPFAIGIERHSLSASVGLSFFPEHGRTPESLLISADEAMYRAKRNGGSQVQIADLTAEPTHPVRFRQGETTDESANLRRHDTRVCPDSSVCIDG